MPHETRGPLTLACYQPYWCEENIWHLCAHPSLKDKPRQVVFISNERRACPLWHQRAVPPDQCVVWDYHVILLARSEGAWQTWDLDSRLAMSLPLADYLQQTFAGLDQVQTPFWPRFRVMEADAYREALSSDRSHMLDSAGNYLQPPPAWPAIYDPQRGMNLPRFIDVEQPFLGKVLDLKGMVTEFAG